MYSVVVVVNAVAPTVCLQNQAIRSSPRLRSPGTRGRHHGSDLFNTYPRLSRSLQIPNCDHHRQQAKTLRRIDILSCSGPRGRSVPWPSNPIPGGRPTSNTKRNILRTTHTARPDPCPLFPATVMGTPVYKAYHSSNNNLLICNGRLS